MVIRENWEEVKIIEEAKMKAIEVEKGEKPIVELSINSVVGSTNSSTIKVKWKINKEVEIVLIDCGATHNFISERLVTLLNLPTKETSNYGVILRSGTTIKWKGICGKIELMVGDWRIIDSFLPLELGGTDVIFGMHWLHSLGVTEIDGRNLIMTFQHEGCKVAIRGDPSLTKARVSLKSRMKSWPSSDQGFLIECRTMEGGRTGGIV